MLEIDSWSDLENSRKFFGIYVIFGGANQNEMPGRYLLSFCPSYESETGEMLSNQIMSVLNEFQIPKSKVVCISSDAGANMKKACELLEIPRATCLAHLTENVLKTSTAKLAYLKELETVVKEIIAHFRTSLAATEELKQIQQKGGKVPIKIPSYSSTRFCSFVECLEVATALGDSLATYFQKEKRAINGLSEAQLKFLVRIISTLKKLCTYSEDIIGHGDKTASKMPKRTKSLLDGFRLIQSLIKDAYEASFESWMALKKNSTGKIKIDATINNKNVMNLVTISILEIVVRMRTYFISRLLTEDHKTFKSVSIDLASMALAEWKDSDFQKFDFSTIFEGSDREDYAANGQEFLDLLASVSGNGPNLDDMVITGDDLETSFVQHLKIADHEEILGSLSILSGKLVDDMKIIQKIAPWHARRLAEMNEKPLENFAPNGDAANPIDIAPENESSMDITTVDDAPAARNRKSGKVGQAKSTAASSAKKASKSPPTNASQIETPPFSLLDIELSGKYLRMIPPSSIDIERAFSVATGHSNPFRNRLGGVKYADEIFVAVNRKVMGLESLGKALLWDSGSEVAKFYDKHSDCNSIVVEQGSEEEEVLTDHELDENDANKCGATSSFPSSSTVNSPEQIQSKETIEIMDQDVIEVDDLPSPKYRKRKPTLREQQSLAFVNTQLNTQSHTSWTCTTDSTPSMEATKETTVISNIMDSAAKRKCLDPSPDPRLSRAKLDLIAQLGRLADGESTPESFIKDQTQWKGETAKSLNSIFKQAKDESLLSTAVSFLITKVRAVKHFELKDLTHWLDKRRAQISAVTTPSSGVIRRSSRMVDATRAATNKIPTERPAFKFGSPKNNNELLESLHDNGLVEVHQFGDGNCFFYSLYDGLRHMTAKKASPKNKHLQSLPKSIYEYRRLIVHYMRTVPELWAETLSEDDFRNPDGKDGDWFTWMLQDGTWANAAVVAAAAEVFSVNITVVTLNGQSMEITPTNPGTAEGDLVLINRSGVHYNSTHSHGHKCKQECDRTKTEWWAAAIAAQQKRLRR